MCLLLHDLDPITYIIFVLSDLGNKHFFFEVIIDHVMSQGIFDLAVLVHPIKHTIKAVDVTPALPIKLTLSEQACQ